METDMREINLFNYKLHTPRRRKVARISINTRVMKYGYKADAKTMRRACSV